MSEGRSGFGSEIAAAGLLLGLLVAGCRPMQAQQDPSQTGPQNNASVIGPDGTAHITRVVPVPKTVSPEAQQMLARPASDKLVPQSLAERRRGTDEWQNRAGEVFRQQYHAEVQQSTMACVPIRMITPATVAHADRILINLHGGGFNSDSGSLTESIPVAALAQTKVIAVLYRLAPEHKFPAAVDDAMAVYREVLKTHDPRNVGIFGTSAGAILTAEVALRLRQLGLPQPAALGIFSGMGDFSKLGDSQAMYALNGFSGYLAVAKDPQQGNGEYAGEANLQDPVLSPMYADLHGLPSTLFITSGRDLLLSGTTVLHRAFLQAGVDARLVVFDALPHAFWNDPALPETKEAHAIMAKFFATQLGR